MQNLIYFNPSLFSPLQFAHNLMFSQNHNGNFVYIPCVQTNNFIHTKPIDATSTFSSQSQPQKTSEKALQEKDSKDVHTVSVKQTKLRKQLTLCEEEEESFKIKLPKSSGVTYKKKNTESNIVNQTFSYLSSDRSNDAVLLFFKRDATKAGQFYRLMSRVKQANKKYINRKYLKRLIEFQNGSQFYRIYCKSKICYITVEQIRSLLRVLTYLFLRDQANITLLTSSKIYKDTLVEHFWRKREILQFLFNGKPQTDC